LVIGKKAKDYQMIGLVVLRGSLSVGTYHALLSLLAQIDHEVVLVTGYLHEQLAFVRAEGAPEQVSAAT
jgi:hypothetical protein